MNSWNIKKKKKYVYASHYVDYYRFCSVRKETYTGVNSINRQYILQYNAVKLQYVTV